MKRMYKLIIADDNAKICEGIQMLIKQHFPNTEIIGIFHDGNSLSDFLTNHSTDLLICDIQMPGADGIEICRRIRENSSLTQIILITAFQEFEYAKNAISYQVLDMLIKPYTSAQLMEAMQKAFSIIDENRNRTQYATSLYLEKHSKLARIIRDAFHSAEPFPELERISLLAQSCSIGNLNIYEADFHEFPTDFDVSKLEFDSDFLSSFPVTFYGTCYLVIFCYQEDSLFQYLEDCKKTARLDGYSLRLDCSKKMRFEEWKHRCDIRRRAHRLVSCILQIDTDGVRKQLDSLCVALTPASANELIHFAEQELARPHLNPFSPDGASSVQVLLRSFVDYYLNALTKNDIVLQIKQYICQNYQNPALGVSSIAAYFNLNSNYISGKFKSEVGASITEFITTARIGRAKELLCKKPAITNEAVATAVGYTDVSYFQRVFKSHEGLTPSHFRRKNEIL